MGLETKSENLTSQCSKSPPGRWAEGSSDKNPSPHGLVKDLMAQNLRYYCYHSKGDWSEESLVQCDIGKFCKLHFQKDLMLCFWYIFKKINYIYTFWGKIIFKEKKRSRRKTRGRKEKPLKGCSIEMAKATHFCDYGLTPKAGGLFTALLPGLINAKISLVSLDTENDMLLTKFVPRTQPNLNSRFHLH